MRSAEVRQAHEVAIDFNGSNYLMIFGRYTNGGYFVITNHGVCGELSGSSDDVFYNEESISRTLNSESAGKALALVIKDIGY